MRTPISLHSLKPVAAPLFAVAAPALAIAMATPALAQTALDTATVSIPPETRKPSTDLTVEKRQTASGYVVTVTNTGPEPVTSVVVTDAVGRGQACRPANPVAFTGEGAPAGSFTVGQLTGQGVALGTLNSGQSATLSFSCR